MNLIPASAEQAQQHQEQVDEIQVEGEGTHQRHLLGGFGTSGHLLAHALQFLHIIRGEAGEDQHADDAHDVAHGIALQEHVHHRSDDDADEADHQDATEFGEVRLGGISCNGHHTEHSGRDEEHVSDGGRRIDQEDVTEADPHDR